ncbi:MAG TPA: Uma2 family endonuclease, partial [Candidatus Nitrosotenuis sp.]|nr:Uma2 family endonuclease [Candidatus Nitrosotenuis sp.]
MTLVQQHVSGEEAGESGIRLSPEDLPRVDHLVTEDDTPVDNLFSAKQQRLLIEPLYSSWRDPQGRGFLADSNVAIYSAVGREPVVPDAFLSLDVEVPEDWWAKENRSYMLWVYGKAPDVVVEIVSNRKGEELGRKMSEYARMAVPYYALFDPQELLGQGP